MYRADIMTFPGSTSAVQGTVVVYAGGNRGSVGSAGFASGLAANLQVANNSTAHQRLLEFTATRQNLVLTQPHRDYTAL